MDPRCGHLRRHCSHETHDVGQTTAESPESSLGGQLGPFPHSLLALGYTALWLTTIEALRSCVLPRSVLSCRVCLSPKALVQSIYPNPTKLLPWASFSPLSPSPFPLLRSLSLPLRLLLRLVGLLSASRHLILVWVAPFSPSSPCPLPWTEQKVPYIMLLRFGLQVTGVGSGSPPGWRTWPPKSWRRHGDNGLPTRCGMSCWGQQSMAGCPG